MSQLPEHLHFLYGLQSFGIKLGLTKMQRLAAFLGNPERRFAAVHIAGTNGKGSTASMLASVLTAAGYRVGLYTSPHLVEFNERIRVDGKKISDADLVRYTKMLRPEIERIRATFFESTTGIAFRYFADQRVDIAVIEAGLGGRFDATNIITPELSIITTIGLEHTEHLGRTYTKIAREKAGIIKDRVACITGVEHPDARRLIRRVATEKKSSFIHSSIASSVSVEDDSLEGLQINIQTGWREYRNLHVSLLGRHQASNVRLAVLAAEYLKDHRGFSRISESAFRDGLSNIQSYSGLHGRIEVLQRNPLVIADVAHNPDGMKTLIASLKRIVPGKVVAVFGVMKDKKSENMIEELSTLARLTIAVQPVTERALPSAKIVELLHNLRCPALNGHSVSEGFLRGCRLARKKEPILVVGSHYVVGEAMMS